MGNISVCRDGKEWSKLAYQQIQSICVKNNQSSVGTGLIFLYQNCSPNLEYLESDDSAPQSEEKTMLNDRLYVCSDKNDADSVCGIFTPEEIKLCQAFGGGNVCGKSTDQAEKIQRRWSKAFYYAISDKFKNK